jgi:hypothetical protein
MRYCVSRMPRGAVSGEIIAGIEPTQNTLQAIDEIAALGRVPDRLHLPPDRGVRYGGLAGPAVRGDAAGHAAPLRRLPPPLAADRRRAQHRSQPGGESRRGVLLAEHHAGFYLYEAYRWLARTAGAPVFRHRMRTS